MATVFELCSEEQYAALVAYETYLPMSARGFVNHVVREPDRNLSAAQEDWFVELVGRAVMHQQIAQGTCALPPTLEAAGRGFAAWLAP